MTATIPTKLRVMQLVGAVLGAGAAIWVWWALGLRWWIGFSIALASATLAGTWLGLQIFPYARPHHRCVRPFDVASWICLSIPVGFFVLYFIANPTGAQPPVSAKDAESAKMAPMIYFQLFNVFLGFVSLWGVRRWRPVGILVRSIVGILLAFAFIYLMMVSIFAANFLR